MTLKVYKKGVLANDSLSSRNYDVPTNPRITTTNDSPTTVIGSGRLFGIVYTDDTEVGTYEKVSGATNLGDEYDNLANTKGNRIKCYDAVTTTGIQLNGISDLATRYYFVLVHSDKENLHHFARITDINTEDVDGASFDFTPKLGNSIPKDTKFMLFKGPVIASTKAVAFTAGLKNEHQTKMYVSRPLFYFIDDLDKKNQLNHNTKYAFRFRGTVTTSSNSVTLDLFDTTFVTCSDFGNTLIDYSKFQTKITITDKLKEQDFVDSGVSAGINETAGGIFQNFTSYNSCFPNARRIDDDDFTDFTTFNTQGSIRYLHYDYSKTISNSTPNVYQGEIIQSNQNRGGFAESKIVDAFRMMPKKVQENDLFRVRQTVHTGSLNEWVNTGLTLGTYDSVNNRYPFPYGISTSLLPTNTQVKVGNRICIIGTIGSGYVAIDKSRLETESTFTTSLSLAQYQSIENQNLYVRSFDAENSILYSTFKPIEGRTDELYVKLSTNNVGIRYLKVTSIDTKNIFSNADDLIQLSALTVSPVNTDAYDSKPFKYALGQYEISIERFYGNIENIHSTKEQGQTIMTISGRDKYSRLLNPIINKNTAFSEDIIYSSYSPLSEKTALTPTLDSANFGSETIVFNSNVALSEGDLLFKGDCFIGEVSQDYSGHTSIVLKAKSRIYQAAGGTLQVSKLSKKQYILNKALSSNPLLESATSLNGASDKLASFTSGVKIHTDGSEKLIDTTNSESSFDLLSGNSALEDTEPDSNAYFITDSKSIGLDSLHSMFLTETEYNTSDKENFTTVNTLMDFTIVSNKSSSGNTNIVTVAPYNPLTLGRVDYNFKNLRDATFHANRLGTGSGVHVGLTKMLVEISSNLNETEALSGTTRIRHRHGEPLYSPDAEFGGVTTENLFLGLIQAVLNKTDSNEATIVLDRTLPQAFVGDLKVISFVHGETTTKLQHELNFINGGHLHGGKYVALLNNFQDQDADAFSSTAFFNTMLKYNNTISGQSETYRQKYNVPLYRISNLEKGSYNHRVSSFDERFQDYYLGIGSKIKYYAECYRGTGKSPAFSTDQTNNHKLFENRGWTSVFGSKFFERPINSLNAPHPLTVIHTQGNLIDKNVFFNERQLKQIDPKVARMFLFINSDMQPYSNTRKDSIRNSNTRTLTNYNLMGIRDGNITSTKSSKSDATSSGGSINFIDSDYVKAIPISSNKNINSGKQFSLMRLTEVVYDWAFNQIDPENLPKLNKTYPEIQLVLNEINPFLDGSNAISTGTISGTTITCVDSGGSAINPHSGANGLTTNDYVCDSNGRVIGQVSSSSSGTTITLQSDAIPTNGNSFYSGQLYKATLTEYVRLRGHGKLDSFVEFEDSNHPLKGTVLRGIIAAGEFGHSDGSENSSYFEGKNRDLDTDGTNTIQASREPNIFFPVNIGDGITSSDPPATDNNSFASAVVKDIQTMKETMTTTTETIGDFLYNNCNIVIFSEYDIEDGGGTRVGEGMTTPIINSSKTQDNNISSVDSSGYLTANFRGTNIRQSCTRTNTSTNLTVSSSSDLEAGMSVTGTGIPSSTTISSITDATTIVLSNAATSSGTGVVVFSGGTAYEFAEFEDITKQKTRTYNKDAQGIIMGIKPHITLINTDAIHSSTDNLNGNHTTTYSVDSESTSVNMRFLDYVDLTGCYLVDIDGKNYTVTSSEQPSTNKADYNPTNIFYIVSHEVDTTQSSGTKHLLTIDGEVPTGTTTYRIMQPNHTCFYRNTPNEIRLNEASPKYTKKAYSDDMYDSIFDYSVRQKRGDTTPFSGQGVMSMYVAIDINKDTDSNHVVIRDADKISQLLEQGSYEMVISDGENSYVTLLDYTDNGDSIGHYFNIDTISELNGVVSISETIEITYSGNLQDCKRLLIGSTLKVAKEAEDLVEELIEDEGITFSNSTTSDYPVVLAPNYKGVNLFTAINQLLLRKNKRINLKEETFEVVESDDNDVYSNILLSDFGDNQIYEYEKEKTLFDFYNEVIVYGRVHKRVSKNLSSIQKVGRKTLEVYDRTLETQTEVNEKARDLLRLHSEDNEKINLTVRQKNISQLRPSDIVNVEIRRENIPLDQYQVLQITHTLDGMMKLQLGKYSKGLEERFAELQLSNAETNASIRTEEQDINANSYDFLENINIKPLRVVVRKRANSGPEVLGFVNTLGFVTKLGVTGGITITDLRELDL